jgi:hypothetical protein
VTQRCHPKVNFLGDWDVWHSSNHWANEETTLRYLEKIFVPYIEKTKLELGLGERQKSLLLWDVFKAHHTQPVLEKLLKDNIEVIFIPPNCTSELQPLDLSVNKPLKDNLKAKFSEWYADQVNCQLEKGIPINGVEIDMHTSVLKPKGVNWVLHAYDSILSNPSIIHNGFMKAGISGALQ